jgi:AcrR family transcriptional regulator
MARTGGDKTKARILDVAERLFAEGGFDATSVDRIARAAKVNKALIYYHFKDKNDIVGSLFAHILDELTQGLESSPPPSRGRQSPIRQELELLARRKRILAVMLMESLKSGARSEILFRCAELVIERETRGQPRVRGRELRRRRVDEFFTGFLPLVAFVALRDRYCEYFGCNAEETVDHFVEAFTRSHLAGHASTT